MTKHILLARIATAHGIKGLVKVLFFGVDITLLKTATLFTDDQGKKTINITLKNSMGKYWLAEVENVTTREGAEALRNTDLYITRDALPETDEGEFYYEDLMNLPVKNEAGEIIGKIISPHNFGAGELLEIQPLNGDVYYLPFNEQTVPEITDEYAVIVQPEEIEVEDHTVEL